MAYLLVHPERYPTNDDVIGEALPEGTPLRGFDDWYGARIGANAAEHERRVVLLDSFGLEDLEEDLEGTGELVCGLSAEGWEIVPCEPVEVGRVVRRLFQAHAGAVTVAGFARHDCVARAVKALRNLNLAVSLDEEATLPLSAQGADSYLASC